MVDNGSRDAIAAVAAAAGAEVVSEPRRGYGRACWAGVRAAAGVEVVVLMDGDGADDPAAIPALAEPVVAGEADLVVGVREAGRREPGSMTRAQAFGNRLAGLAIRLLLGARVADLGPLRAVRRRDLLALEMSEMTYGWSAEMTVKALRAGYRYREPGGAGFIGSWLVDLLVAEGWRVRVLDNLERQTHGGGRPAWINRSTRPSPMPDGRTTMSSVPISDYAVVSDCRSAALVSRTGSVDWLCLPRFDGPSIFARILDSEGGHWLLRPAAPARVTRRYLEDTMVLETTFHTADGRVVLTDVMPVGPNERGHGLGAASPGVVLRLLTCTEGEAEVELEYCPRPGTGSCSRCSSGCPAGS